MPLLERLALSNRWRAWHPLEKVLPPLGLLALTLLLPPRSGGGVVLLASTLLACAGAGVSARIWFRLLALPGSFLVLGGVAIALSPGGPGGPLLVLTPEGVAMATEASLRALAGSSALLLLAATTPLADLLQVGRMARVPEPLLELVALMYRFVGLTAEQMEAMGRAQASRLGWSTRRRRVRSAGLLAAAFLPRVMARGERLEIGLRARSLSGTLPVFMPPHPPTTSRLGAGLLLLIVVAGLALGLEFALERHVS